MRRRWVMLIIVRCSESCPEGLPRTVLRTDTILKPASSTGLWSLSLISCTHVWYVGLTQQPAEETAAASGSFSKIILYSQFINTPSGRELIYLSPGSGACLCSTAYSFWSTWVTIRACAATSAVSEEMRAFSKARYSAMNLTGNKAGREWAVAGRPSAT